MDFVLVDDLTGYLGNKADIGPLITKECSEMVGDGTVTIGGCYPVIGGRVFQKLLDEPLDGHVHFGKTELLSFRFDHCVPLLYILRDCQTDSCRNDKKYGGEAGIRTLDRGITPITD